MWDGREFQDVRGAAEMGALVGIAQPAALAAKRAKIDRHHV